MMPDDLLCVSAIGLLLSTTSVCCWLFWNMDWWKCPEKIVLQIVAAWVLLWQVLSALLFAMMLVKKQEAEEHVSALAAPTPAEACRLECYDADGWAFVDQSTKEETVCICGPMRIEPVAEP